MAKAKKKEALKAEEKIKVAARKLFTERGYDAVKTRDIAAEAGINLALLNYYFRSKENLFEIIMFENFEQFIQGLMPVLGDEELEIDDILERVVAGYIDLLNNNPDLPMFVLNSFKAGKEHPVAGKVGARLKEVRAVFMKRVMQAMKKEGKKPLHIAHYIANFMGLVIFPFVGQPILMRVAGMSKEEFHNLMEERKKLIPVWLKAIRQAK